MGQISGCDLRRKQLARWSQIQRETVSSRRQVEHPACHVAFECPAKRILKTGACYERGAAAEFNNPQMNRVEPFMPTAVYDERYAMRDFVGVCMAIDIASLRISR
jgi:hypothetical protein